VSLKFLRAGLHPAKSPTAHKPENGRRPTLRARLAAGKVFIPVSTVVAAAGGYAIGGTGGAILGAAVGLVGGSLGFVLPLDDVFGPRNGG
jgi:hypothetical protein